LPLLPFSNLLTSVFLLLFTAHAVHLICDCVARVGESK
jgi:hypothetical protein